jgi:hypothetical protein
VRQVLIDDESDEVVAAYNHNAGLGVNVVHIVPGTTRMTIPDQPESVWKEMVESPRNFKLDRGKGTLKKVDKRNHKDIQ